MNGFDKEDLKDKVIFLVNIPCKMNGFDKEDLKDKVIFLNERLRQLVPSDDLIDNSNLDRACIGRLGLHLNRLGNIHLARNFKQALSHHL